MPKNLRKPSYLRHKPTGQARVRINGKDHYLGEYGSPESRERYDELIADWFARQGDVDSITLTIDDMALLYLNHAEGYYVKNGQPTGEVPGIRVALRLLIEFAGRTRCRDFGPRLFREFRDGFANRRVKNDERTISRQYANKSLRRIVRMFKWAAREELVPVTVWQALTSVEGLKKGRSKAREAAPVRPVVDAHVEAVLPFLSSPVRAMVDLQRLTGMCPGELVELHPRDVTRRTDDLWCYRPERQKTEHRDHERIVFLGPKAQAILAPWLDHDLDSACFSPREAVEWFQPQSENGGNRRSNRRSRIAADLIPKSRPERRTAPRAIARPCTPRV